MEALRKTSATINRGAATGRLGKRIWWNVVEYKSDPILGSPVNHAVLFLVVYLVRLPDF
jgi:hypothetical protein